MSDYRIVKLNEAYVKIECDKGYARELSEYFTFYVPNYQFNPKFKKKLWDGKIRLLDLRTLSLYHGLVPYVQKFCEDRNYSLEVEDNVSLTNNFSLLEAREFIQTLNLPYEVRDYQEKAFVQALRNKRILILSPTGSGKSLIIYLIVRALAHLKKGILIVPTTSLVEQMYSDFEEYGFNVEKYCHRQYAGKEKDSNAFLTITTWQSIYSREPEYFEQFNFVIGDESHLFKAQSLSKIMTDLVNAKYRIGTTGTLDGTNTHKLVLEGLFGPVFQTTTTRELIDNKHLADFKIKCLILKHPEEACKWLASKKWDYKTEMDYIVSSPARNKFIKNLALSLEGNTLILFQLVDKHGKHLHDLIKENAKNRKVFYVHGGTDTDEREAIRKIVEKEKNAIIVASYGTYSTGINIKNLHNVIFASPYKAKIKNLQSIGRVLRKGDNKDSATLFDISDDFRIGSKVNTTLKHFTERVAIYDSEKFDYTFYNIELMKNG